MCKKNNPRKIDDCMSNLITLLKIYSPYKTLACCCGHRKYPMTVVIKVGDDIIELMSNIIIPRKKRFYKKDKEGYYFIPEVCQEVK